MVGKKILAHTRINNQIENDRRPDKEQKRFCRRLAVGALGVVLMVSAPLMLDGCKKNKTEDRKEKIVENKETKPAVKEKDDASGKIEMERLNQKLIEAAKKGSKQNILDLLEQDADVNAKDSHGQSALWNAVYFDNIETAEQLIRSGAYLYDNGKYNTTLLVEVSSRGHEKLVGLLLEEGKYDYKKAGDLDAALVAAVVKGSESITKMLLGYGASPDAADRQGEYAVWKAFNAGKPNLVEMLLKAGADPTLKDKGGAILLIKLAEKGHDGLMELVVQNENTDLNVKDAKGETALMKASALGYQEIVKLLLDSKKIDANAEDPYGDTALWKAWNSSKLNIVETIVKSGKADVDAKNKNGDRILWLAYDKKQMGIVKLLMENKADVNEKDKDGRVLVIEAIKDRNVSAEVVEDIVYHGADLEATNAKGETVKSAAKARGSPEIDKLLE